MDIEQDARSVHTDQDARADAMHQGHDPLTARSTPADALRRPIGDVDRSAPAIRGRHKPAPLPSSYRLACENLLALRKAERPELSEMIAVVGYAPGAGTTTTTLGLARSFASRQHETLLIDSGYGGNNIRRALGLDAAKRPPSVPLMTAPAELIIHVAAVQIDVMLCDGDAWHAFPANDQWDEMLLRLRARYRSIVVDAGHFRGPGPRVWNRWADRMLLVIDTKYTTVQGLERARKEMAALGIHFDGLIMNRHRFPVPRLFHSWMY
jgi:Mrp family chromosome partitioning ATPase